MLNKCLSNLEAEWPGFSKEEIESWKDLKEASGREESKTEGSRKRESKAEILSGKPNR